MSRAILDDHLLRDLLSDDRSDGLVELLARDEPATTSLYLHRLCRSVVSSSGGALTGGWDPERRQALGARLTTLPADIEIIPLRDLAYRMAQIADTNRVSTLGAEAVAAAEHLDAPLCVWDGDDAPGIRGAIATLGLAYRTVSR